MNDLRAPQQSLRLPFEREIPIFNTVSKRLTLNSIITPFDAFKYHVLENTRIMENGAFALLEQMPHFP